MFKKIAQTLSLLPLLVSCQVPSLTQIDTLVKEAPALIKGFQQAMRDIQAIQTSPETSETDKSRTNAEPPKAMTVPTALETDLPLAPLTNIPNVLEKAGSCLRVNACLIETLSGNGREGYLGDNQLAQAASFRNPSFMTLDKAGNIFISDSDNHRIRKIDHKTGLIQTVAGNGQAGFSGDGGLAIHAQLNHPTGLAVDAQGHLYISDNLNHRIRRVHALTGQIETILGKGFQGYNGDDKVPTLSALNNPQGLSTDGVSALYIADQNNQRIRRLNLPTQTLETVVGTGIEGFSPDDVLGKEAKLRHPSHLLVAGNQLYISETGNHRIRQVDLTTGHLSTLVGSGQPGFDADLTQAKLTPIHSPAGLWKNQKQIYFADQGNHRIRKVDLSSGEVTPVAGLGSAGFSGDKQAALKSELKFPRDLALNPEGELLILDAGNQRIRQLTGLNP